MNKKINVLSLFGGMECGCEALKRVGIEFDKYYSSEIDKYATKIASKNHPEIIHLGDVKGWADWEIDWSSIDLLFAGFPCQSWSIAGKQRGDEDPRGQLLWVMLDILKNIQKQNPNVKFLFENVVMKMEFIDYINNAIGVEPIIINSALVSAQHRERCYWVNFGPANYNILGMASCDIPQPKDKGILLKNIIHEYVLTEVSACSKDKSYCLTARYNGAQIKNSYEKRQRTVLFEIIKEYMVPFDKTLQILDKEVEKGKVGYFQKDSQANRVYYIHDKAVTLCGEAGGGAAKMGQYLMGKVLRVPEGTKRGYTDIGLGEGVDLTFINSKTRRGRRMEDKCNCLTATNYDYCLFGCITPDRVEKRQNGQRFSEGKKFYTLTAQDKHGILIEGYIRKLTPIECERLQTLPDNYTEGVSDSQRYKMLGNGWTVDVIAHILGFYKEEIGI